MPCRVTRRGSRLPRAMAAAGTVLGASAAIRGASWPGGQPWPTRPCRASGSARLTPTALTLSAIADALKIPGRHLLTEYGSPLLARRVAEAVLTPGDLNAGLVLRGRIAEGWKPRSGAFVWVGAVHTALLSGIPVLSDVAVENRDYVRGLVRLRRFTR
jgi:hypothetical protein